MKDILQKFLQWLIQTLTDETTFAKFASAVLWIADLFFNKIVEFVGKLVEDENEPIVELIESGATSAEIAIAKSEAAARVDIATSNEFSGSPTYVPGFVRRAIRDAWAYLINHAQDSRNESASGHGFFRAHTDVEIKEIVEKGLNTGWNFDKD